MDALKTTLAGAVLVLAACSSTTVVTQTPVSTAPAPTAGPTTAASSAPASSATTSAARTSSTPATGSPSGGKSSATVDPAPYTMDGGAGRGVYWVSPTGNLHCGIGAKGMAGCQSSWPQPNPSLPECSDPSSKAPMATLENGDVKLQCTSQAIFVTERKVELPYGSAVTANGITCTSTQAGMACTNDSGRGFVFSKDSILKLG